MRRQVLKLSVIAAVLLLTSCIGRPTLQDISPDLANGISRTKPSSAGLTVALAGDSTRLYAVSLNAGVWRSDDIDHPWEQLPNGPPRACSIAVDPGDRQHVVVGEREDDKMDTAARHSGLWETRTGGDRWDYVLDPYTLGCSTQAIPSVAINAQGVVLVATSCGVARRATGDPQFTMAPNTTGLGAITAVTTSPGRTWARTSNLLLVGDTQGMGWTATAFPAGSNFSAPGELHSLAASDEFAYVTCCTTARPPCGGANRILIYNRTNSDFTFQPDLPDANGNPALGCDGTGLGGSKFIRAFPVTRGRVPEATTRLFFSAAQEIYEASGFLPDGSATGWTLTVGATCKGCTDHDKVHTDFWDVLLDPLSGRLWLANDGGVYERSDAAGSAWVMRNQGLHTHHIHTLTLMGNNAPAPAIAYPTSDNEAWMSKQLSSPASWRWTTNLGDVNWSAGDIGNPHQAVAALRRDFAAIVQDSPPGVVPITLSNDRSFDGPEAFHFIQTLNGENVPDTTLDAVILTTLPLQYVESQFRPYPPHEFNVTLNVPGDLGSATNGSRVVLLRNPHLEASPDINISKGTGWSIETDVPAGTARFWVSGGHDAPHYYAYAVQSGKRMLFRQERPIHGKPNWRELNVQGKLTDPLPYPESGMVDSVWKGPVFVNPFVFDELYVLTETGVRVSTNGGASFEPDTALTALITRGAYPLTPGFSGGNEAGVRKANRSNLNPMGALADMAFRRDKPNVIAAASPYGGLFYKADGTWYDLSSYANRPFTPISSVAIDSVSVYFATEGRGVFRMIGYEKAPLNLWARQLARRLLP